MLNDARVAVTNRWVLVGASFFFSSLFFVHPLIVLVRLCLPNDDLSYLILTPSSARGFCSSNVTRSSRLSVPTGYGAEACSFSLPAQRSSR